MPDRVIGVVKFFSDNKGYGFIRVTGRDDVFVHKNDLVEGLPGLSEKQKVSFIVVKSDRQGRGDRATQVRIED